MGYRDGRERGRQQVAKKGSGLVTRWWNWSQLGDWCGWLLVVRVAGVVGCEVMRWLRNRVAGVVGCWLE
ncbi:hypothetical protein AMTR_s00115p00073990 [Amborella trichopoda]|uniref:Uncharacterized protein n=1 Tax=Amborella trichopoda TaxID=13333 RepID=W1NNZ9_AMBTC|nr:hypothetical protein AMTR_s00115p00073990 [Amborella trichopoda]